MLTRLEDTLGQCDIVATVIMSIIFATPICGSVVLISACSEFHPLRDILQELFVNMALCFQILAVLVVGISGRHIRKSSLYFA